MAKQLWKGNEAISEAAIIAGVDAFFGYPITPQNEVPEYFSKEMPKHGRVFIQAESEVAAINMVYGAAAAGARVLTSSSSPGIALKQEGISYLHGAHLPCVIINVMRGGPGLGDIQPSQADYFQMTRGGGNGDYYSIVMAPETVQEAVDMVKESFELADYISNPVQIMIDGFVGQMMAPVEFDHEVPKYDLPKKDWALIGTKNRGSGRNVVKSLSLKVKEVGEKNKLLNEKYNYMRESFQRYELYNIENPEIVIVAFGTLARIAKSAIAMVKKQLGLSIGLIRPKFVWPFPNKAFKELPKSVKGLFVFEMNLGQMIEDVKIAAENKYKIGFLGRSEFIIPTADLVLESLKKFIKEIKND